jgi:hypothetical protein
MARWDMQEEPRPERGNRTGSCAWGMEEVHILKYFVHLQYTYWRSDVG